MKLGEWIKTYRKAHSMSMQAFADKAKLSKAYIGMLEKGVNPTTGKEVSPTIQTFEKIASGLNMDLDSFLKQIDGSQSVKLNSSTHTTESEHQIYNLQPPERERGVRIPVLGRVVAGIPIDAVEEVIDWEEIPARMARHAEYFGLRITGQSMEPTLQEGDTVIVRRQDDVDNGDIAIVLIDGDTATVKEIKEAPEGVTLIAHNVAVYSPHFYSNREIEELPIRILGKVVEVRRKL